MKRHLVALAALGAVVVLLAAFDVHTPVRPVLTLAFFALAPGAAIVARLRIGDDPLLAATIALGLSIAVTMALAQAMVWTGVWSPVAAALVILTGLAVAARPTVVSR